MTTRSHLQRDANVDSTAETGADRTGGQSETGEELSERRGELDAGSLLRDHTQRAHTAEVDAASLECHDGGSQALRAQVHDAVRTERVTHWRHKHHNI